jgi:alkylation response protein AidB-like acyl-CoA dehydrogenase
MIKAGDGVPVSGFVVLAGGCTARRFGDAMKIDHDEIMRRVAALAPLLAANSRASDTARRVAPASIAAMAAAGMFRISQPSRNGGYELSLRTLADAVIALSQACPSSGWVLMVVGAHHWCMGSFPEAAQDEVFGEERDALIAGTLS